MNDQNGYQNACEAFLGQLKNLSGRILIAHHGDGDGIIGGGLLGRFLLDRGHEIDFVSCAEFRLPDLELFKETIKKFSAGIFVEAQGMPEEYCVLNESFLNIDHHPHPQKTPITRMLNPRRFQLFPVPSVSQVIYELLKDALPGRAWWFAALGSKIDYCHEAAAKLIRQADFSNDEWKNLRDTFLACQYVAPFSSDLAHLITQFPSSEVLLNEEPFHARRDVFQAVLKEAIEKKEERGELILARTVKGKFRISSPLANSLQDKFPHSCVIVIEEGPKESRFSFRNRKGKKHLGEILQRVVTRIRFGNGNGHEKAASARVPKEKENDFLEAFIREFS